MAGEGEKTQMQHIRAVVEVVDMISFSQTTVKCSRMHAPAVHVWKAKDNSSVGPHSQPCLRQVSVVLHMLCASWLACEHPISPQEN